MYIFNNNNADGNSLVPVINLLLGDNVVGAEVGILKALTTCTLVQNCPNIKKLYAIDCWKPYEDYMKEPYTDTPALVFDEKSIEFRKLTALHNIKYSGVSDRIKVMDMDSNDAVKEIEDNVTLKKEETSEEERDKIRKIAGGFFSRGKDG